MGVIGDYALYGVLIDPGSLPGAELAAVISQTVWMVPFVVIGILLLVYPTGQFMAPGWRWAALPGLAAIAIAGIAPIAWRSYADHAADLLLSTGPFAEAPLPLMMVVGILLIVVELLAAALSLILRWRRANGVERLQLKWLVVAGAVNAAVGVVNAVVLVPPLWLNLASALGNLTIPTAVAVAVLRYRLYEIDRIVSRTVSYAVITTVLVTVYVTIAVVPSIALGVEADLLVAIATLVAAGGFVPLRRTV